MPRSRRGEAARGWRLRLCSLRGGIIVDEDVSGTRFLIYPEDRSSAHYWIAHVDGSDVFAAMRRLVPEGGVALDVGAHFGLYAAEMSRRVGQHGRVYAFEPVTYTYWRLRETIALNRLENVTAERLALSSHVGTAAVNVFPRGFEGWNTMLAHRDADGIAPEATIEVPVATIDHYCETRGIDHAAGLTSAEVFAVIERAGYGVYRFLDHERRFKGPPYEADADWANYFAFYRDPQALL
jgi:FkbM family methyltransferase